MAVFIMVTFECKPFTKGGGLADIPYNIGLALCGRAGMFGTEKHELVIIMPRSGCKVDTHFKKEVLYKHSRVTFEYSKVEAAGMTYYLIGGGNLLDVGRGGAELNPYPSDHRLINEKALEFCKAAHVLLRSLLVNPEEFETQREAEKEREMRTEIEQFTKQNFFGKKVILQAHDWLSSFILPLVKTDPYLKPTPPSMYTIHNYFHLTDTTGGTVCEGGVHIPNAITYFNYGWFKDYFLNNKEGFLSRENLLTFDHMGVYFADVGSSVSEGYAKLLRKRGEIELVLTDEKSKTKKRFYGILNGINRDEYSPEHIADIRDSIGQIDKLAAGLNVSIDKLKSLRRAEDKVQLKQDAKALLFELLKNWKHGRYLPKEWAGAVNKDTFDRFDLEWHADDPLVVMVGRIAKQKGPDNFMGSLPYLVGRPPIPGRRPSARYLLAGGEGGHSHKVWDAINAESDLHREHSVFINQVIPSGVLPLLFMAADVFVAPSRYEPCGLMPLEVMATGGTPCVVSPIGGLVMIVKDKEVGSHIEHFNIDKNTLEGVPHDYAIADAINRVLKWEEDYYYRLIDNCLEWVERDAFSWDHVVRRYLRAYRYAIESYARFIARNDRKGERDLWRKVYTN